jgi:cysteine desulfurase/selenocysteine lyase
VIDAVTRGYAEEYANVHRGLHTLSTVATERYEAVRGKVQRFLNAATEEEIVFTSGTTEGINLVAHGWAMPRMEAGDESSSHPRASRQHCPLALPARTAGRRAEVGGLRWQGRPRPAGGDRRHRAPDQARGGNPPVECTCTVVDVKAIVEGAHAKGVPVLVDGSQGAVHMPGGRAGYGCDFLRGHRPQAVWPLRLRRDLHHGRPPEGDAARSWAAAT